jgi:hypothetical protein
MPIRCIPRRQKMADEIEAVSSRLHIFEIRKQAVVRELEESVARVGNTSIACSCLKRFAPSDKLGARQAWKLRAS